MESTCFWSMNPKVHLVGLRIMAGIPAPRTICPGFSADCMALGYRVVWKWTSLQCAWSKLLTSSNQSLIPVLFLWWKILMLEWASRSMLCTTFWIRRPCNRTVRRADPNAIPLWRLLAAWEPKGVHRKNRFLQMKDACLCQSRLPSPPLCTGEKIFVFISQLVDTKSSFETLGPSIEASFPPRSGPVLTTTTPLRWRPLCCKLTAIRATQLVRACWKALIYFLLWSMATY